MKYKILERKKAGDKTEVMPGLFSKQYDDSLTVEIDMSDQPRHIYPSDILKIINDNGTVYYFGSSTLLHKIKNARKYCATYWRKKPVW